MFRTGETLLETWRSCAKRLCSDVAHFSVWCCDVLRCFALLVRLLQLLSVRCDVRKRCAGALSCAVLLRALSDCARTRHFGRYVHTQGRGAERKHVTSGSLSVMFFGYDVVFRRSHLGDGCRSDPLSRNPSCCGARQQRSCRLLLFVHLRAARGQL